MVSSTYGISKCCAKFGFSKNKNMEVITNPNQVQLKQVKEWNLKYEGDPRISDQEDDVVFFVEYGKCLGYAQYEFVGDTIVINWFCAPKNGTKCFAAFLEMLQTRFTPWGYTHLALDVFCSHKESPKAAPARFNLYFSFGFVITRQYWPSRDTMVSRMQRPLQV